MAAHRFSGRASAAALSLITAALLAACGGGGSSDAGTPTGQALAITADNANAVARAGVMGFQAGDLAGSLDTGLLSVAGTQQMVWSQVRRAMALGQQHGLATASVNCPAGGTLTFSLNETNNNNNTFDAVGESLTVAAVQCKQQDQSVVNGSMSLKLTQFTNANQLAFTLSFAAFSATDGTTGAVASLDGGLTVSRSSATASAVRSDSFTAASTVSGVKHGFTVTGFEATLNDDGVTSTQTVTGTFSGSDFGYRTVTISTPVPVQTKHTDDYPSVGTVLAKGAAGSQVKVEALSNTQARVSVDANGDGSFETVNTVPWTSLQ